MTSDLRIAILTTETPHHMAFVRAIAEVYPNVRVFEENRPISVSFDTNHEYGEIRDAYEIETWFNGDVPKLTDFADVETFPNLNDENAVASIKEFKPDAIIVFGTGRIGQDVIDIRPNRIVALHGADPEQYRGLDTHLWAIYHGDFDGLLTTLHRVDSVDDNGGVVTKMPLHIHKGMKFHELRKANCDSSIRIVLFALKMLEEYDQFISQPQRYVGRHYSFMPAVLIDRCIQKFYAHILSLPE